MIRRLWWRQLAGVMATAIAATRHAAAQPMPASALPVVGFLGGTAPSTDVTTPFLAGLDAAGWREGHHMRIEYRWAHNQPERLPGLMAELLTHKISVIAAHGGAVPVRAAQAATSTVPIIFLVGADPVATGLVPSLARPGGNTSGVYMLTSALNAKRLQLLHEMVPRVATMAVLIHPRSSVAAAIESETRRAAAAAGVQLRVLHASDEREIDAAFADIVGKRIGALVVSNDAYFAQRHEQIAALTLRHKVPAVFEWRRFATRGGLTSYGSDLDAALREFGGYVARVLGGAKPAELPVLQPTRFELVINGKTANALGLSIPAALRLRADDVIQ